MVATEPPTDARDVHSDKTTQMDNVESINLDELLGEDPGVTGTTSGSPGIFMPPWLDGDPKLAAEFLDAQGDAYYDRHSVSNLHADINQAVYLYAKSLQMRRIGDADRGKSLVNFGAALLSRYNVTENRKDLETAIRLLSGAVKHHPPGHPLCIVNAKNLASSLLSRYDYSEAQEDLGSVVQLYFGLLAAGSPDHPDRETFLEELYKLFGEHRDELFDNKEQVEQLIAELEATLTLRPKHHPTRVDTLSRLAVVLSVRYDTGRGSQADLDKVIGSYQEVLQLRDPSHPQYSMCMFNLALSLHSRYDTAHHEEDLEKAIQLLSRIHEHQPNSIPSSRQYLILTRHAKALLSRFESKESIDDVHEMIRLLSAALELCSPGHPARAGVILQLGDAVHTRYLLASSKEDIDLMVQLYREALALYPANHDLHEVFRQKCGYSLYTRYGLTGDFEDLKILFQLYTEHLDLCPVGHPDRDEALNNMACALLYRYELQGAEEDLKKMIDLHSEALELRPLEHPSRAVTLVNLGNALRKRYTSSSEGTGDDLTKSIELYTEAIDLTPITDSSRSDYLVELTSSLRCRHGFTGAQSDLDRMIQLDEESLELAPPGRPGRWRALLSLANSICTQFYLTGAHEHLWRTIELISEAVHLCPEGHPQREVCLGRLANALQLRYRLTRTKADLQRVIQLFEEALQLCPVDSPSRLSALNNLAASLTIDNESLDAVQRSIELHTEALNLQPVGHPGRLNGLMGLSAALHIRFRVSESQDIDDLKRTVALHEEALNLRSQSDPNRGRCVSNLADALFSLFQVTGDLEDFAATIKLRRESTELYPSGHPLHAQVCEKLALTLVLGPSGADADEIIRVLKEGATDVVCALPISLTCTINWVVRARDTDHTSLEEAYKHTIQFLRRYLTIGPTVKHQYDALQREPWLLSCPMDAAAHAISKGNVEEGVEIVEAGRSLLWSDMRRFREPLDGHTRALMGEDLANSFETTCASLQGISTAETCGHTATSPSVPSVQTEPSTGVPYDILLPQKQKLLRDYELLQEQIRAKPGLEDFQRNRPFQKLQLAAKAGPIILIICSRFGSYTVIVFHDKPPILIPLDSGDEKDMFYVAASDVHRQFIAGKEVLRSADSADPSGTFNRKLLVMLQRLWTLVVEQVVETLKPVLPAGSRVWWCPTSFLTDLPFHAAGNGKHRFIDYYVSSYTPTLQTLIEARFQPATSDAETIASPRILAVVKSEAQQGFGSLKSGADELHVLNQCGSLGRTLQGSGATSSLVLSALSSHSWAHFICHGTVDSTNPFNSSLHLHSSQLSLDSIIKAHLPNAQFAFLAACHTAEQGADLQDETLHLAAAMQFSGFRSVIGTLWAMVDKDGPEVARGFYGEMLRDSFFTRACRAVLKMFGCGVGSRERTRWSLPVWLERVLMRWAEVDEEGRVLGKHERAARAIWTVTRRMRKEGKELERWINFIHIGV